MKIQYDLEGAQLKQQRSWGCSKLVLAFAAIVLLLAGSALDTILFHRYWDHDGVENSTVWVNSSEIVEITTVKSEELTTTTLRSEGVVSEASVPSESEMDTEIRDIEQFEVKLDESGFSVSWNRNDGSVFSVTEDSSDWLKEFAGMFIGEVFNAIREQQSSSVQQVDHGEITTEKVNEIAELSSESTEVLWSWSTADHDGFRIQFNNGEWSFERTSRDGSDEESDA